jgi:hypothetical protein
MVVVSLAIPATLPIGCAGPPKAPEDPVAVLSRPSQPARDYLEAMRIADASPQSAKDLRYLAALRRMVVADGYVVEARRAAFSRSKEFDPNGLREAIELGLPKMTALEWRRELCGLIARDRWTLATPALIRAWAAPVPVWDGERLPRPEREALVAMYGDDLAKVLLDEMRAANPITQANLRMRCWELLLREGNEASLRALLADPAAVGSDAMLIDLARGVNELGVLPRTREEVLWLRTLCTPGRKAFWEEARTALAGLPEARRRTLEIRDLAVVVGAARHRPELLTMDDDSLYRAIHEASGGANRRVHSPEFEGHSGIFTERLFDRRGSIAWGDAAAMLLVLQAFHTPEVRAHLFTYVDRDHADRATEYGGVLRLDPQGRYELLEFPPRVRVGDNRFEASQEMFDASYEAIAQFHQHCMRYDNGDYAGPHLGDFQYADATRMNGVTVSCLDANTVNLDFYRHGRFVVDLGTLERPSR